MCSHTCTHNIKDAMLQSTAVEIEIYFLKCQKTIATRAELNKTVTLAIKYYHKLFCVFDI